MLCCTEVAGDRYSWPTDTGPDDVTGAEDRHVGPPQLLEVGATGSWTSKKDAAQFGAKRPTAPQDAGATVPARIRSIWASVSAGGPFRAQAASVTSATTTTATGSRRRERTAGYPAPGAAIRRAAARIASTTP